jgi:hypothetical protein
MSALREPLSQTWLSIQISLFPWLSEELATNQEATRIGGHIRADMHCDPNIPF